MSSRADVFDADIKTEFFISRSISSSLGCHVSVLVQTFFCPSFGHFSGREKVAFYREKNSMDHDQAQYRQLVDDGNFSAAFKVRSTSLDYELQDSFLIKEIRCSILEFYSQ